MKRIILILLLLPSLAWGSDLGQDYARMNPYILGGGASAACSTPTGDMFTEGFETPGAEESWTEIDGDAGELTWNANISGLTTGMDTTVNCTYGLHVNTSNDPGYARVVLSAPEADLYVKYSIYVVDGSAIGTGQYAKIFMTCDVAGANCSTGTQIGYMTATGTRILAPDASHTYNISDGRWYYIEEYINSASESCTFKVGQTYGAADIANLTYTCGTTANEPQRVYIGQLSALRTLEHYYGYIVADNDGTF